jgi:ankyrin repeat protein
VEEGRGSVEVSAQTHPDHGGDTPLHMAAERGHWPMVAYLLSVRDQTFDAAAASQPPPTTPAPAASSGAPPVISARTGIYVHLARGLKTLARGGADGEIIYSIVQ